MGMAYDNHDPESKSINFGTNETSIIIRMPDNFHETIGIITNQDDENKTHFQIFLENMEYIEKAAQAFPDYFPPYVMRLIISTHIQEDPEIEVGLIDCFNNPTLASDMLKNWQEILKRALLRVGTWGFKNQNRVENILLCI